MTRMYEILGNENLFRKHKLALKCLINLEMSPFIITMAPKLSQCYLIVIFDYLNIVLCVGHRLPLPSA